MSSIANIEVAIVRRRTRGAANTTSDADGLEEDLLPQELAAASQKPHVEAARTRPDQPDLPGVAEAPRLAVERVQHDAAPLEVRVAVGLDLVRQVHAHDDVGVGEDASVRAELDALGESRDHLAEPRAEGQRRDADAGKHEEEAGGHEEHRHASRAREPQEVASVRHRLASRRRAGGGLAHEVLEQRDPAQQRRRSPRKRRGIPRRTRTRTPRRA